MSEPTQVVPPAADQPSPEDPGREDKKKKKDKV
jgi:hypothetical protein